MTESLERARADFLAMAFGIGNSKRKTLWSEFGYPKELQFKHYYRAYNRNATAFAAVNRLLDACWIDYPVIVEGDVRNETKVSSEWELQVEKFLKRQWQKVKEADKRNMVGSYSALLLQVRDGLSWDQPVDVQALRLLGEYGLVKLIPVWQSQLTVNEYQTDELAEDYGEPLFYQFNENGVANGQKSRSIKIHPSRVLLFNEDGDENLPETGVPLLQAGYNNLLDLEKTSGGSAEGFLKNASRQLGISFGNSVDLSKLEAKAKALGFSSFKDALNDNLKRLNQGTDSALITQEGATSVLSVAPADPRSTWEVSANEFASSVRIPFTILFGQQTGRLASDEDKADWAKRCNARRKGFLTDVIRLLLERLWQFGILPMPEGGEITVSWSDLLSPSENDKLANAQLMANIASTTQTAFGQSAVSVNEIRELAGLEPLAEQSSSIYDDEHS